MESEWEEVMGAESSETDRIHKQELLLNKINGLVELIQTAGGEGAAGSDVGRELRDESPGCESQMTKAERKQVGKAIDNLLEHVHVRLLDF